ncbi:MAG: enoyl-CoA hydratase/isomerase family protein [Theionarchaea archaeon]|nr:enoyl-CoA hydratase/isomerase family protein [Theionarchaea archaeon]MBU6999947.1 enoyl-CoA hydratase/isomerase family protein [Theionarchaea archaeon]MBU7020137.1 enoyl-CoA hydratase/isomerase family protein [Theionarchaea archaeon]MBU7035354.1 enoyl-CoA hydratase/isomerase family protein [Theionarchaea archaeon]MBU7041266.1 enoyl-CoA hydratase/isomerase family protein [Theionarchaea archaeon]
MYDYTTLDVKSKHGVLHVVLNRPDVYNAFNEQVIEELTECFTRIPQNESHCVVLTGNGRHFCAGADLGWMQKVASYTKEENSEDSRKMALMFETIDRCPKPVIGRVNGSAFGGGVGLTAVCDYVVCSEKAHFAFSEINLGIVPAVISTYVLPKIGISRGRALFLSGERFTAHDAVAMGLVHTVCPAEELDRVCEEKVEILRSSGPRAMAAVKEMMRKWSALPREEYARYTTELIASLRASEEGKEGISAFLEKRRPVWR